MKLEEIGHLLCDIHEMIEQVMEHVHLSTTIEPLSSIMKWFSDVVLGCAQVYDSSKTKKSKKNGGKQHYGQEVQRGFEMDQIVADFDNFGTKFQCAVCGHGFVITHGESKEDIAKFNQHQQKEYDNEMKIWKKNKQKGKSPKKPTAKCKQNACLCGVMHSNGHMDSGNCLNCKQILTHYLNILMVS